MCTFTLLYELCISANAFQRHVELMLASQILRKPKVFQSNGVYARSKLMCCSCIYTAALANLPSRADSVAFYSAKVLQASRLKQGSDSASNFTG